MVPTNGHKGGDHLGQKQVETLIYRWVCRVKTKNDGWESNFFFSCKTFSAHIMKTLYWQQMGQKQKCIYSIGICVIILSHITIPTSAKLKKLQEFFFSLSHPSSTNFSWWPRHILRFIFGLGPMSDHINHQNLCCYFSKRPLGPLVHMKLLSLWQLKH